MFQTGFRPGSDGTPPESNLSSPWHFRKSPEKVRKQLGVRWLGLVGKAQILVHDVPDLRGSPKNV